MVVPVTVKFVLLLLLLLPCISSAKKELAKLKVEVVKAAEDCSGGTAAVGDTVTAHYTGTIALTGQVFDSSRGPKREPFRFTIGKKQVIKGFDEGFQGMCVGELRRLTIPPHLGYGDKGSPPVIPGGATLVFDVELMSLEKKSFFSTASFSGLGSVFLPVAAIIAVVYFIYERAQQEKTTKSKAAKGVPNKKRR